jgi:hypothetical protein
LQSRISENRRDRQPPEYRVGLDRPFYYRPGRVPERLGVLDPGAYPDSNELWKVMKLPFVSRT